MSKVVVRKNANYSVSESSGAAGAAKQGGRSVSVILACCIVLAVGAVLVAPLLTGGASAVSSSSVAQVAAAPPVTGAQYPSVDAAAKAIGFMPVLPSALPAGFAQHDVKVLEGAVLEVNYTSGKETLVYRVGQGNEDLSYSDKAYPYSQTQETGGVTRTYEGSAEKKLNTCVWVNGDYSYALVAADGISGTDMHTVAESVA